jgi:dimethylargininase
MPPLRIAIVRPVSRGIIHCELTHLARSPIDYPRAVAQHEEYQSALKELGCELVTVPAVHDMPDAVFVEDAAIVLDDVAVMTRPGALSRRGELLGVEKALAPFRPLAHITDPATLDGGDVLLVGRRLFVGRSRRSNDEGIEQLRALVAPYGYDVRAIDVHGCLHLKSAVTTVENDTLLGNGEWVERDAFPDVKWIEVDRSEPHAANGLQIERDVIYPQAYPRTAARLRSFGISLRLLDASELAKAEGGVTCCSLVFATK